MKDSVSLIIPVYNEVNHLEEFLQYIDEFAFPFQKELVVIDDCSTDGSGDIIKNFQFKSKVLLLSQASNKGKGAAIRLGIQHAEGLYIGIQDADLELDQKDIQEIVSPLIQGKADVVYGSRFKKAGHHVQDIC